MDIARKIRDLIEKPLLDNGIYVDLVEYVKENNTMVLRIVIDQDKIVDLDTCMMANKIVDPIIDGADFINDSYVLEVSSKEKGDNDEC